MVLGCEKSLEASSRLMRVTKGALTGGFFAGAVASACVVLFFSILLANSVDMDFERKVEILAAHLVFAAVSGGFVGAIGGIASRLPIRGVPLLTSIGIVGSFACVARLITLLVMPFQKLGGYPYTPTIVAAFLGGAVALACGAVRDRGL
jgi:hypothetical protein